MRWKLHVLVTTLAAAILVAMPAAAQVQRVETEAGTIAVTPMASGLVHPWGIGREVTGEERIPLGARIREVEQAPDGSVYVLTDQDDGAIWRLSTPQ